MRGIPKHAGVNGFNLPPAVVYLLVLADSSLTILHLLAARPRTVRANHLHVYRLLDLRHLSPQLQYCQTHLDCFLGGLLTSRAG